jgi:hypothetical protein
MLAWIYFRELLHGCNPSRFQSPDLILSDVSHLAQMVSFEQMRLGDHLPPSVVACPRQGSFGGVKVRYLA